jgi:hypothetical protein
MTMLHFLELSWIRASNYNEQLVSGVESGHKYRYINDFLER